MIWTGLKTRSVGSFRLGLQERPFGYFALFWFVITHPS